MAEVKILCWNVNGIRAVVGKGFLEWLHREAPDIICLQETKAYPEQLDKDLREPSGYHVYWNHPERKGYGGVATFTKVEPVSVKYGFASAGLDLEGRVIIAEYPDFVIFNVYSPNGKKDEERLKYKMDFYETFLGFVDSLKAMGAKLIICGDFNTAHKEIDLARPKENEHVSGFLPIERAWMDEFVAHGYVDHFSSLQQGATPVHLVGYEDKSSRKERGLENRLFFL